MGQMRFKGYGDKATIFLPTKARYMLAREEVADYEFVECGEPPDLRHGIMWAHSLGASPPDIFGEILITIDRRIEQVKGHKKKQKGRGK